MNYNRFISAYSKIDYNSEKIKEEMIRHSLKDMMIAISDEVKEEVEENYLRFQKKISKISRKEKGSKVIYL